MNDISYTILKLTNGDDIICEMGQSGTELYEVQNPLQIITTRQVTSKGVQEGISLARWAHPFTEQNYFSISASSVVTTAKASPGISQYYEYILRRTDDSPDTLIGPSDEDLEELLEEEEETFLELESPSKKFH